MERRHGFGFSNEAKQYARDRSGGHCEYGDGRCPNPNTGRVNHITGALEGWLIGMKPEDVGNPRMNATMQCEEHEAVHDATERFQVQCLKGEMLIYERRVREGYRRCNRRTQSLDWWRASKSRR